MTPDKFLVPIDFVIVSGGQTGADRAALDWAIDHGVPHGGWCPQGRKAEDGPISSKYNLRETRSKTYLQRTRWNVRDSDATAIFTFTDELAGGSFRAFQFAIDYGKPCLHVNWLIGAKVLARFLKRHPIGRLNIAGSRESSAPGIHDHVYRVLDEALLASIRRQTAPGK